MKHTHKPNQNSNTTEPIIIIVPGHATIDTTKTIHQLIEVLDHIS